MTIISRYLLREVLRTWLIATLALIAVLVVTQFFAVLRKASAGEFSQDAVMTLLGLSCLKYLTYIITPALFLSIMLTLGRLYRDSEMAAMVACGVGPKRVLKPMLVLGSLVCMLVAWFAVSVNPWTERFQRTYRAEMKKEAKLSLIEPGRFRRFGDHGVIFAAEGKGDSLRDVFIRDEQDSLDTIMLAKEGTMFVVPEKAERGVTLRDGVRYESSPGDGQLMTMTFDEAHVSVYMPQEEVKLRSSKVLPTSELIGSTDRRHVAELHWRISMPIAVLMFVLVAIPLSKTPPRKGIYGRLLIGILVYVVYSQLLGIGKKWLAKGKIPPDYGLWWVHLILLLFLIYLWCREFGVPQQLRFWRS